MPMPDNVDATTPKFLRDKYAIVGVGETDYKRGSTQTTRAMATFAVKAAMARCRAEGRPTSTACCRISPTTRCSRRSSPAISASA